MPDTSPVSSSATRGEYVEPFVGWRGYLDRANRLEALTGEFEQTRQAYALRIAQCNDELLKMARRARDGLGVASFIALLAGSARLMGDETTAFGWSLLTLSLVLVFGTRCWLVSARLRFLDVESARVAQEARVVEARHLWLERAARITVLLARKTQHRTVDDVHPVRRAMAAERKLRERRRSERYAGLETLNVGWSEAVDQARKILTAAILAATINCLAFGIVGQGGPAVSCGLAAGALAGLRLAVSLWSVNRRAATVSRIVVWNKQRDLLTDVDLAVRNEIESLLGDYRRRVVVDLRN